MFSNLKNQQNPQIEWLKKRSLRFRFTLLFSVILAGALIAFSLLLYRSFVASQQEDFDVALFNHAVDVASGINVNSFGQLTRDAGSALDDAKIFPFSLSRTFMQIRSVDDQVLAIAGPVHLFNLPFIRSEWELLQRGRDSVFRTLKVQQFVRPWPSPEVRVGAAQLEDESYRLIGFPLGQSRPTKLILQIAAPLTLYELQTASLRRFFFLSIPLALLLAAVGGYFLAGLALKPVDAMVHDVRSIGVDRLSARLPVPEAKDELQRLAVTMNELLERVEQAMAIQERFIADASHQLLTPLAILRGELDVVKARDPDDVKRYLESASQEVDRLSRTVRDMLLLARADAGTTSLTLSKIGFDELLLEATERVNSLAERKGVRLRFHLSEANYDVRGDRDLLLALLQNLLENAIKYSPQGGLVEVGLVENNGRIRVTIADQGPGIQPDEMPRIFERFYRAKNTSQTEGMGLGLAIAKKISDVHQGQLEVRSVERQGTTFSFEMSRH